MTLHTVPLYVIVSGITTLPLYVCGFLVTSANLAFSTKLENIPFISTASACAISGRIAASISKICFFILIDDSLKVIRSERHKRKT